jgi:hypothetical protein
MFVLKLSGLPGLGSHMYNNTVSRVQYIVPDGQS